MDEQARRTVVALDPKLVRAEAGMRHAFACAGDEAGDEMFATLRGLSDVELTIAVNLARLVINEVLKDVEPEGLTDEDIDGYAQDISVEMAWAKFDAASVATYLRELVRGKQPTTDDPDTVALSFVSGGYLVAGAAPEDQNWTDYLDDVLDRVIEQVQADLGG